MALRAGYKGIKKYIADKLNRMNPDDSFATDAEIAAVAQAQKQLLEDTVGWTVGNRNPDNNSHTIDNSSPTARSYRQDLVGEFVKGEHYRVALTLSNISGFETTGKIRLQIIDPDTTYRVCTAFALPDSNGNYVYDIVAENSVSSAYAQIYINSSETGENATVTISNIVIEHFSVDVCKADNSVITRVENGTNPSKEYAVGEHFIRDGAFCTVTQPMTTESTFVLNTNYTAGDVASELEIKKSGSNLFKYGKIVILSLTSWTNLADVTIPNGYKPNKTYAFVAEQRQGTAASGVQRLSINSNGVITLTGSYNEFIGTFIWFT